MFYHKFIQTIAGRGSLTAGLLAVTLAGVTYAQVSVTTSQNDNSRTGANLSESTLTTSNVNVSQFGKLSSLTVDGYLYAQPLYVPNVTIAGTAHNVVFVATMNDTVYAFDADNLNATSPLWQTSLGTAVRRPWLTCPRTGPEGSRLLPAFCPRP